MNKREGGGGGGGRKECKKVEGWKKSVGKKLKNSGGMVATFGLENFQKILLFL